MCGVVNHIRRSGTPATAASGILFSACDDLHRVFLAWDAVSSLAGTLFFLFCVGGNLSTPVAAKQEGVHLEQKEGGGGGSLRKMKCSVRPGSDSVGGERGGDHKLVTIFILWCFLLRSL